MSCWKLFHNSSFSVRNEDSVVGNDVGSQSRLLGSSGAIFWEMASVIHQFGVADFPLEGCHN